MTQNTTSNKNTISITNNSQGDIPFPAGDHKAAMNRRESMRNTIHKNTKGSTKEVPPGNGHSLDAEARLLLGLVHNEYHIAFKIYDEQDEFNFETDNFPFMDGDDPTCSVAAYDVYISELI